MINKSLEVRRVFTWLGNWIRAAGFFCLIGSHVASGDDASHISWRGDLGSAQLEAKSKDLLLWIQFTGPWCGNCRKMERSTFAQPAIVREAHERFVPVKLRSDEYENLTQSLGLTVLPSTVLVRPNGEVVKKFEGYGEPEVFETFLRDALSHEGRSPEQIASRLRAKTAKDAAIALAGYDPVSLLQDQKLIPGRADLTAEHEGRVFRFSNEADRDLFLAKPAAYTPMNDGQCPVSQVDRGDFHTGDPRLGVVYNGHLFLFKSVADRNRFAQDPERYAAVDHSGRSTCPHCRERTLVTKRLATRFSNLFVMQRPSIPAGLQDVNDDSPQASTAPTLSNRLASFLSLDSVIRR